MHIVDALGERSHGGLLDALDVQVLQDAFHRGQVDAIVSGGPPVELRDLETGVKPDLVHFFKMELLGLFVVKITLDLDTTRMATFAKAVCRRGSGARRALTVFQADIGRHFSHISQRCAANHLRYLIRPTTDLHYYIDSIGSYLLY